jgi:hypothetical protein
VTREEFRQIAASLSDVTEAEHMAHPDFRTSGRVFATLGYPTDEFGMVKLAPEEQSVLVGAEPTVFSPASGAWGRQGSTLVRLAAASESAVRGAIELAWKNAARHASAKRPGRAKRSTNERPG